MVPPFDDTQLHILAGSASELGPQPVGWKRVTLLFVSSHFTQNEAPERLPKPVPSSSGHPGQPTLNPYPPDLGVPFRLQEADVGLRWAWAVSGVI